MEILDKELVIESWVSLLPGDERERPMLSECVFLFS